MTKGVNISHWYAQLSSYSAEHFDTKYTQTDLEWIQSFGFRHVRLPIDHPAFEFNERTGKVNPQRVKHLLKTVRWFTDRGIFVQLDLHPFLEEKERLRTERGILRRYIEFWKAMAPYFRQLSPDDVAFELLSEPSVNSPELWWRQQGEMVAALRPHYPGYTFIVGADGWNRADLLAASTPYEDPNLVYVFHYYDPFVFTHQSTGWGIPELLKLRWLDYPPNPSNISLLLERHTNERLRQMLREYARTPWSKNRLFEEFRPVAEWAKKHEVPLICNEFGANQIFTRSESHGRYLKDIRKALDDWGIGWTLWDYSSPFGVMSHEGGQYFVRTQVVEALGLDMKP